MAFKQQQNQVFGGPEISNIARTPSGVVARALQCMKGVDKDFYESIWDLRDSQRLGLYLANCTEPVYFCCCCFCTI